MTQIGSSTTRTATVSYFNEAVPDTVVSNADLCAVLDTSNEWIVTNTGIENRRYLEEGLAASDLAAEAARKSLDEAGIDARDLDAIVISTGTPDQPFPSCAVMVKEKIGATRALPLDLTQAACSGGLMAMELASSMVSCDRYTTVLVIAVEVLSRQTDPTDRTIRVFFGDAAGAAIVTRDAEPGRGIVSSVIDSELDMSVGIRGGGSARPLTHETLDAGEHLIHMNGRRVMEMATKKLPEAITDAVREAGLEIDDVDNFIFHQANINIIHAALDSLGVDRSKAPISLDRLGNTGSASIFTALAQLRRAGGLTRGETTVIATIGAGFIWGALVVRH
ncbi:3-oxoacyl-ACP synthase III family protein [Rhodococcus sp. NPDC058521]|uniref:3-oxoacyl-ACP synthase III family protein n=1 Tax=Rhodococcus sp. NPDC058521 TaxID=3346536 RepID=UPI00364C5BD5